MFIKVLDPENRTIERDTRFTKIGTVKEKENSTATWFIPFMTAKFKEFQGMETTIEELKALTGVAVVFISAHKSVAASDMFIIFRDIDVDGKADVPDDAQLQVLKHINGDEQHYSMDYSLGEVTLDWPFDVNSLENAPEVH